MKYYYLLILLLCSLFVNAQKLDVYIETDTTSSANYTYFIKANSVINKAPKKENGLLDNMVECKFKMISLSDFMAGKSQYPIYEFSLLGVFSDGEPSLYALKEVTIFSATPERTIATTKKKDVGDLISIDKSSLDGQLYYKILNIASNY